MKNKCTLDPKVVVQSSELDIARQTIKEALMRLQQMQKRLSVENNGKINDVAKYGQKNNGGFMTMSPAVNEVNTNIFGNIPNSSVVPTLPSTGTLMEMGTLWGEWIVSCVFFLQFSPVTNLGPSFILMVYQWIGLIIHK
jgi:hypothetical protein